MKITKTLISIHDPLNVTFQVLKLESSTPYNVYVLECDESQQNTLTENDWTGLLLKSY